MTDDPNADKPLDDQADLPADEDATPEFPAAGGEVTAEDELADEEVVESTPAEEGLAEPEPEPEPKPARQRPGATSGAAALAAAQARSRTRGVVIDPALRIRDRVSEAFVIGTVLVFAVIFLNAMAFGKGGALSPTPSPAPSGLVESAAPSSSPIPTVPPIPTEFQVPTHSPGPSASVAPSPS
jgi:hypothetical protein